MTEPLATPGDALATPRGALLQVIGLTVDFVARGGSVRAVDGIDLALWPGEVLALIGESGSGKSATLNAIAGLLPKAARAAGMLRLAGRAGNLLAANADRRGIAGREIGMVFQNPAASLNPVLDIGEQIDEVVEAHQGLRGKAARCETLRLLDRVGIGDAAQRVRAYPHQLSGGLKQRVAIAAAIAGRPRIILADEPTTALDATVQAQILDLLLGLVDTDGVGLVFVTHDLAVAGAIADRIAVMYAGRVVETGPARTLAAWPAHPYTAALAAAALPFLDHAPLRSGKATKNPSSDSTPTHSGLPDGVVDGHARDRAAGGEPRRGGAAGAGGSPEVAAVGDAVLEVADGRVREPSGSAAAASEALAAASADACSYAPRCPWAVPACVAARPPLAPHDGVRVACIRPIRPGEAAP